MLPLLLMLAFNRPDFVPVGPLEVARFRSLDADIAHAVSAGIVDPVTAVPGQYVVGFKPGKLTEAISFCAEAGIEIVRIDTTLAFAVVVTGGGKPVLVGDAIRYVESDCFVRAALIPNDPLFRQYQWDKWVMYADQAWDLTTGGRGVRVAVLDNGVDYNHPDLAAAFEPGSPGYDFVNNDPDPRPDDTGHPYAFHGTHVAGIIAAAINNRIGLAGWAETRLVGVKVLADSGTGTTSALASGIRWAADNGCRVLNMSLGGSSAPTALADACSYAVTRNCLLLAAAGNEGSWAVNFPAAYRDCVAVGALSPASAIASFSNRGSQLELCAPGVDIASTIPGGTFALASGTSMATPQVSGVAALLLSQMPALTAGDARRILAAASVDMGAAGRDELYGFGLVNARRALDLAALVVAGRERDSSTARLVRARTCVPLNGPVEVIDCTGRVLARGDLGVVGRASLRQGVFFIRVADSEGAFVKQVLTVR